MIDSDAFYHLVIDNIYNTLRLELFDGGDYENVFS